MPKQMTLWFPADVKPARAGIYEILTISKQDYYAYWTGQQWGWGCTHLTIAGWKDHAFSDGAYQEKVWRGFTEEQK